MCGIAGFVGGGDLDDIQMMTAALVHRGPDDTGLWTDPAEGVYLGHRRLSIIDIACGHQPMQISDGRFIIVHNGEIYNFPGLRRELEARGHRFFTDHSDTEVLLHGYREWGEALPEKLNGMWAFVIYDRENKRLFLSRDRFGKKPLFYSIQNGTFAFASELSALILHSRIHSRISPRNLRKYFAYGYIPAPGSFYRDIHKLPGGHNLSIDIPNFSLRKKKYWEFVIDPFTSIPKNPEEEWGDQLRELLHRSVTRRLISDVPIGVLLSGGIDSSTITAFAAGHLTRKRSRHFPSDFGKTALTNRNIQIGRPNFFIPTIT